MSRIAATSSALAVALLGLIAAADEGRTQEQQSFKTLMSRGYDVRAVTFARGESTDNREVVLVTLQKEKSVAVCYFAAANWINLNNATLEDAKRCDVR
jgi:predicted GNAT superfamily acetyltransferase